MAVGQLLSWHRDLDRHQLGTTAGFPVVPADHLEPLCDPGPEDRTSAATLQGPWMSELEERLLAEIEALRGGLEALRVQVGSLERRVREAEGRRGSTESYSFVSEEALSSSSLGPAPSSYSVRSSNLNTSPVDPTDTPGRTRLAEEIGQFLRRCVTGHPRGPSGRDRLALQNRCYVVVRTFEGVVLDPPHFHSAFAPVREQCKRGSNCGSSAFVGFPSKWEARVALRAGGFALPPELRDEHSA